MMLVTHLVDNVVEDDKYDNGNRYHNDRLHPDLEVLRLLAVDLRLEAALLVADMQLMFLNVRWYMEKVHTSKQASQYQLEIISLKAPSFFNLTVFVDS